MAPSFVPFSGFFFALSPRNVQHFASVVLGIVDGSKRGCRNDPFLSLDIVSDVEVSAD
jgi:hypothetical protein